MNFEIKVFLLILLFLVSCTKSSSSNNNPTVTPTSNTKAAIYFISYKQLNRFVPSTLPEKIADLSFQSSGFLGSNEEFLTDSEVLSLGKGFQINLRQQTIVGIQSVRTISLASSSNYFIRGPVQPSADGNLLIVPISLSSADGLSVRNNGFIVMTGSGQILLTQADAVDPVWISNTEIISANKDELQKHNIQEPDLITRLGPLGLGEPGSNVRHLAVSPNHRKIAFIQNEAIYLINVDGTGLFQLTSSSPGLSWPTWSPDGNQIAVVTTACPGLGSKLIIPEVVVINTTIGRQNLTTAKRLVQNDGNAFRACGPLYWK